MVKETNSNGLGGLSFGEFPADRRSPFGTARKMEKGIPVNPFLEDLKDLFETVKGKGNLPNELAQLIEGWKSTARVKELLKFGFNYHETGSVHDALARMVPNAKTERVAIQSGKGTVDGDIFGIIGRRHLAGDRVVFDCVVATDYGLQLATMSNVPGTGLKFAFRKGFELGKPTERTIEDVVVPQCRTKKYNSRKS